MKKLSEAELPETGNVFECYFCRRHAFLDFDHYVKINDGGIEYCCKECIETNRLLAYEIGGREAIKRCIQLLGKYLKKNKI